jgi:hypothetical protein
LHNDLIVYFDKHAPASIPEGRLAIAVTSAGAGDDMRQAELAAGEADVDELIFWQLELSHYRLPFRTPKAEPFLIGRNVGLGAGQYCREDKGSKTRCGDFHFLQDTNPTYLEKNRHAMATAELGFAE